MILEDKKQIAEVQAELRAAGSVMALPPAHVIEAECRRIAESGAKLETFEERRPILEKLVDLKIFFNRIERTVEIEDKIQVPDVAEASGLKRRKCNGRFGDDYNSVLYIPFRIKERVT